jgi:hypothetical protein
VRFEEFRDVAIHDTDDPAVIIAEYELSGTVTTTHHSVSDPETWVGDVEQDVHRLAGADQHRVLPHQIRLDHSVAS